MHNRDLARRDIPGKGKLTNLGIDPADDRGQEREWLEQGGFLRGESAMLEQRGEQDLVKRRGKGVLKRVQPVAKFKVRRQFLSIDGEDGCLAERIQTRE